MKFSLLILFVLKPDAKVMTFFELAKQNSNYFLLVKIF